jgi:drug/metabolite transporter (DMT)-like permease
LKANILLFITSIIWGFAFVAQRAGMEFLEPLTFNAIRFALGTASLIPLLLINKKRNLRKGNFREFDTKYLFNGGLIIGIILFIASGFQQAGIVYTTAGKAGFITGLYIVLVPILGLFIRQKTSLETWLGVLVAVTGLYFLSITENFSIELGDLLVLISAFIWAAQILLIGFFSTRTDAIQLAVLSFFICAAFSFIAALISETIIVENILKATVPILYAGICSVGIAYTLQIVAQREAHPANAAIIMSLESVFALIGGWLMLGETISLRGLIGCSLMLTGMILSQINLFRKTNL